MSYRKYAESLQNIPIVRDNEAFSYAAQIAKEYANDPEYLEAVELWKKYSQLLQKPNAVSVTYRYAEGDGIVFINDPHGLVENAIKSPNGGAILQLKSGKQLDLPQDVDVPGSHHFVRGSISADAIVLLGDQSPPLYEEEALTFF